MDNWVNAKTTRKTVLINTNCCNHLNSNTYRLGYIVLPFLKVAICDSCDELQPICKMWLKPLFDFFFNLTGGRVTIIGDWISDKAIARRNK